jgi:hypothetical protein
MSSVLSKTQKDNKTNSMGIYFGEIWSFGDLVANNLFINFF